MTGICLSGSRSLKMPAPMALSISRTDGCRFFGLCFCSVFSSFGNGGIVGFEGLEGRGGRLGRDCEVVLFVGNAEARI